MRLKPNAQAGRASLSSRALARSAQTERDNESTASCSARRSGEGSSAPSSGWPARRFNVLSEAQNFLFVHLYNWVYRQCYTRAVCMKGKSFGGPESPGMGGKKEKDGTGAARAAAGADSTPAAYT
ncbi:hypothetical protein EVAR_16000_1 [Eumeta japonica]|uniref:Uncharacterized protein n=1 Tax=Eumeta variegata TaxID=151549 RepID=A0A4C1UMA3_EUMVA|nr:hypothetical protein EVAR_16000_1 [Eumeta japonica]